MSQPKILSVPPARLFFFFMIRRPQRPTQQRTLFPYPTLFRNDNPLGSDIDSCIGTVADGSPINTSTNGTKTFTVTAFDLAGNRAVKTVTYRVAAAPPFIHVSAPNGGQIWARGVSHAITWTFHD